MDCTGPSTSSLSELSERRERERLEASTQKTRKGPNKKRGGCGASRKKTGLLLCVKTCEYLISKLFGKWNITSDSQICYWHTSTFQSHASIYVYNQNILYIKMYQHKKKYIYYIFVFSFLSGFLVVLFGLPCFFSQGISPVALSPPSSSSPFVGGNFDCGSVPWLTWWVKTLDFLCLPVENVGMENQQATRLTILHSGKILSIWFFSTDIFLADQFSIDFFFEQNKVQRFSAED